MLLAVAFNNIFPHGKMGLKFWLKRNISIRITRKRPQKDFARPLMFKFQ